MHPGLNNTFSWLVVKGLRLCKLAGFTLLIMNVFLFLMSEINAGENNNNGAFRILHLQYNNPAWDVGIKGKGDYENAFLNYLISEEKVKFRVEKESEVIKVTDLLRFIRGKEPPFVYITGTGKVDLDERERKAILGYLLHGGTIIAEAGDNIWLADFMEKMNGITNQRFKVIPNEDDVYVSIDDKWAKGVKMYGIKNPKMKWCCFLLEESVMKYIDPKKKDEPDKSNAAKLMMKQLMYFSIKSYIENIGLRKESEDVP